MSNYTLRPNQQCSLIQPSSSLLSNSCTCKFCACYLYCQILLLSNSTLVSKLYLTFKSQYFQKCMLKSATESLTTVSRYQELRNRGKFKILTSQNALLLNLVFVHGTLEYIDIHQMAISEEEMPPELLQLLPNTCLYYGVHRQIMYINAICYNDT